VSGSIAGSASNEFTRPELMSLLETQDVTASSLLQMQDAGLVRPSVTYSTLTETILLLRIYNKLHYYISLTLHLPMGIDTHGNKSHSHSHTGCFPFLPIPIPNFVTNSHSHGIPMGFPFPLGIPFPWSSLVTNPQHNILIKYNKIT